MATSNVGRAMAAGMSMPKGMAKMMKEMHDAFLPGKSKKKKGKAK